MAGRRPIEHHRVANPQAGPATAHHGIVPYGVAQFDYPARSLVAEYHRHGVPHRASGERQVGVADAGGLQPHPHLARTRRVEFEFDHLGHAARLE